MGRQTTAAASRKPVLFSRERPARRIHSTPSKRIIPPGFTAGNRINAGYVIGTGNRLLSEGTRTFSHDGEGNRIGETNSATGETWAFQYDHRNQMTSAELRDSKGKVLKRADYRYDVFGNRIEQSVFTKANGTVVSRFAFDGVSGGVAGGGGVAEVWADLNEANKIQRRYLRGGAVDQIIARSGPGKQSAWYWTDHLGSVRLLTDEKGKVKDEIDYEAFGRISRETNPDFGGRYKYTGREYDPETGLYYYRRRHYDPVTGRMLSEDPIGFAGGDLNLYRYVQNEPTTQTDPTGEQLYTNDNLLAGVLKRMMPIIRHYATIAGGENLARQVGDPNLFWLTAHAKGWHAVAEKHRGIRWEIRTRQRDHEPIRGGHPQIRCACAQFLR